MKKYYNKNKWAAPGENIRVCLACDGLDVPHRCGQQYIKKNTDNHQWKEGKSYEDNAAFKSRTDTRVDECGVCGLKRHMNRKVGVDGAVSFEVLVYEKGVMKSIPASRLPECK